MQLQTPAFPEEGRIPEKNVMPGAGGHNVSIPLEWSDPPEGTRSFALTTIDPHEVADNWIHWMVVNIPAEVTSLKEGASGLDMPKGARELKNSFGETGWGGPQPPAGTGDHPYVTTVYALDTDALSLSPDASLETFRQTIEGHVLGKAKVTGYYRQ